MHRLIGLAVLAAAIGSAGSISYNAYIGCANTCVTVSLSWAGLPVPVVSAGVLDSSGRMLFELDVPFPAVSTGSILPNPQTVFGLSAATVQVITNGRPASSSTLGTASLFAAAANTQADEYANVCVLDSNGNPIHTERFIAVAATEAVPEPGSVYLAIAGLSLLGLAGRTTRRRSRR